MHALINQYSINAPFVPDEESPYIFVSYAHKDRERVFPIIKDIYEDGWRVWFDEGLELGEDYYGALKKHIRNCSVFLLFASKNSLNSDFITIYEIPQAYEFHKKIIVLYLNDSFIHCGIQELNEAIHTDSNQLKKNLNEIECLSRTQKRKAVGRRVQVNILKQCRDNNFRYVKCIDGIRITDIESKDSIIYVPEEYPPFDNQRVVEIDIFAFLKNKSLKDVYVPANVKITNKYGLNLSRVTCAIHYKRNSIDYIITKESELKTIISDEFNLNESKKNAYAYISVKKWCEITSVSMLVELQQHRCSYTLGRKNKSKNSTKILIKNCTCFVAFIDKQYVKDDILNELRYAIKEGKKIAIYQLEECELPKDLSNLQLVHQLRYDNGSEEERATKLINWLTANGCRDPYAFIDFEYEVTNEGIRLIKYTGKRVHPEINKLYGDIPVVSVGGFRYCDFIESIEIPKGVSNLSDYAFAECKKLRSIIISTSVNKIGCYAFENCINLKIINIPNDIKYMGEGVFSGCKKLKTLLIPSHIPIAGGVYRGWPNLKHIKIPEGEYEISNYAFDGCIGLESVVMHDNVTKIGCSAFANCINLKEIIFSKSIIEIDANAFSNCCSLKVIKLPKGLKKICGKAFSGCTSLEKVIIPGIDTELLMFYKDLKKIPIFCAKGSWLEKLCEKMNIPYSLL
ncbi:MAG: leucine-rich repeat protein [Lachnospiraceae bacterium]|nr:leucine-rich repeat protein [Lachnospiraceae bacterium]